MHFIYCIFINAFLSFIFLINEGEKKNKEVKKNMIIVDFSSQSSHFLFFPSILPLLYFVVLWYFLWKFSSISRFPILVADIIWFDFLLFWLELYFTWVGQSRASTITQAQVKVGAVFKFQYLWEELWFLDHQDEHFVWFSLFMWEGKIKIWYSWIDRRVKWNSKNELKNKKS